MPPAIPSSLPSRPWWSRSKSSKDSLRPNRSVSSLADDDEKYPSTASTTSSRPKDALPTLKFNTLASAIGLKSKKLPALTIQDPPPPIVPAPPYPTSRPGSGHSSTNSPARPDQPRYYTNRPPAKSVSTVRSSDYDYDGASEPHSEPRTPSDLPRDRFSYQHSIMTFSEIDPFASGGIVVQQIPQDPNRLSVYSDSSVLDPLHKHVEPTTHNRVSYGSSSSNSHGNYSDAQALSPLSPNSFGRSPTASRSAHDLSQTRDSYSGDGSSIESAQALRARRMKTPSGSNSSNSTVTQHDYRGRLSEPSGGNPAHLPRKRSSPMLARPRGLTVGAIDVDHRPLAANATPSPVRPLQVRRKASGSSSPSSSNNTPSPSPVTFTRSRTTSSTSNRADSPVSPGSSKRPLVIVRKASSSRLPPSAAPPTSDLPPPPPLPSSPYELSPIEFRTSSSSSSLNFAPSVDLHDFDSGDAISRLMNDSYDYGPFEVRDAHKGKRGKRNMYVLDGDMSPVSPDLDSRVASPLSKFPPVPTVIHGDVPLAKAGKLLRKMSSQQSLLQRHSAGSTMSSASGFPEEASSHVGKTPRKQRSFHASRVPLPPLPGMRHGSSTNGHPSASVEPFPQSSSPILEPRRSSITSPRKRLFSGSSTRRSTSSHGPTSPSVEDDKRSIFSFDSDIRPATSSGIDTITMSFSTAGAPLSLMTRNACISPSSLWEMSPGGGDHSNNRRVSQSEYIPQYIMSPAEQLKLAEKLADEEATVSEHEPDVEPEPERVPKLDLQPGDFGLTYSVPSAARSRSNSVLSNQSTGTLAFGNDKASLSRGASILSSKSSIMSNGGRPSTATSPVRKVMLMDLRGPARSSSMLAKSPPKHSSLSARPSTAQASLAPPTSPGIMAKTSPIIPSASLPPPPRRRPSRHDLQELDAVKRTSVVPMNPLSPPPSARMPRRRLDSTESTTIARPPSSFDRQKVQKRRSLMKKPSFLDIEDENDVGVENGSDDDDEYQYGVAADEMESSFLDMERGSNSFDTVRSTDSAFFA